MSETPKTIDFQKEKDRRLREHAEKEAEAQTTKDASERSAQIEEYPRGDAIDTTNIPHIDPERSFLPADARGYAQNLLTLFEAGRPQMLRLYGESVEMDPETHSPEAVEAIFTHNLALRRESLKSEPDETLIHILEDHRAAREDHGLATIIAAAELLVSRVR